MTKASATTLPPKTFLVVDDSAVMRKLVVKVLEKMGQHNVFQATGGKAALKIFDAEDIDFIISDWNMPGMNGFEFLYAIRARQQNKDVPFFMLTAEANQEYLAEAKQLGVTRYITKPFKPGELITAIRDFFA